MSADLVTDVLPEGFVFGDSTEKDGGELLFTVKSPLGRVMKFRITQGGWEAGRDILLEALPHVAQVEKAVRGVYRNLAPPGTEVDTRTAQFQKLYEQVELIVRTIEALKE